MFDPVSWARWNAALEAEWQRAQDDAEAEITVLADAIAENAKAIVPYLSGTLHDSIDIQNVNRNASGTSIDVGSAGVDYAEFVEFGTSSHDPEPFMRPAMAEAMAQWGAFGPALAVSVSKLRRRPGP